MIKFDTKTKELTIQGMEPVVLVEYSAITQHLMEVLTESHGKDKAMNILQNSFDLAFKTKEEIEAEIKQKSSELMDAIMDKIIEKFLSEEKQDEKI